MRKLLLPILVLALVLSSCKDDLTSLNQNPKGATDVPADPLFSNALVSLGTLNTTPDYNINMFKFMAQYWSATTYADESQYNLTGRSIPSNYWSEVYRDVLNDLDEASTLVANAPLLSDAEKTVMQAQIEVVKVMAYHQLVSVFGNIPYTEALKPDIASPSYDDAATIYSDLLSRLNTAIADLNAGSSGFSATTDVFYNGDVSGWIKFANSLKMRMAIQLADVQPNVAQTAIEEASPNAFMSNADNLVLDFTNTPPTTNPIWEELIQSGRNDFVASNTLIDMMNKLNDPRRAIQFSKLDADGDGTEEYVGGPYGASNDYTAYSHIVGPILDQGFEGVLLEYAEVEFIRAEANARGWLTGTAAQAAQHYNNAIEADMQYWSDASASENITATEITKYQTVDAPYPIAGSLQEQLKAIAEQKWLGLYLQGLQAWTEWRRLDHPTWYVASNPGAETENDIPVRFIYPVDEQNLNQANWEEASQAIGGDQTSTHLFWDVADASSVE